MRLQRQPPPSLTLYLALTLKPNLHRYRQMGCVSIWWHIMVSLTHLGGTLGDFPSQEG